MRPMRQPIVASRTDQRTEPVIPPDGPIRRLVEGLTLTGTGPDYFRALVRELTQTSANAFAAMIRRYRVAVF